MRRFWRMLSSAVAFAVAAVAAVMAAGAAPARAADAAPKSVRVEVLDASGKPAKDAEVALVALGAEQGPRWQAAPDGGADLAMPSAEKIRQVEGLVRVAIAARAAGHAPALVMLDPASSPTVTVRLPRGKRVDIEINSPPGRPVPEDLMPAVLNAKTWQASLGDLGKADASSTSTVFSLYSVERRSRGRFRILAAPELGSLYVFVNHPGFIRGLWSGPFPPDTWGKPISIKVPEPGAVTVTFDPKPAGRNEMTTVTTRMQLSKPSGTLFRLSPVVLSAGQPRRVTFDDLAPGNYDFSATVGPGAFARTWSYPESMKVEGGSSVTVALTQRPGLPAIRVVDAATTARAVRASAIAVRTDGQFPSWTRNWVSAGPDGRIRFDMNELYQGARLSHGSSEQYTILLTAPGFAARELSLDIPSTAPEVVVRLERGRPLEIVLEPPEGMTLPADLMPAVWPPAFGQMVTQVAPDRTRTKGGGGSAILDVERTAPGRFKVLVTSETKSLVVGVHHPGFLRGYRSEPFAGEALAGERLVVPLPKPGALELKVDAKQFLAAKGATREAVLLSVSRRGAEDLKAYQQNVGTMTLAGEGTVSSLVDLAPGKYDVSAHAQIEAPDGEMLWVFERKEVQVEPGVTARVEMALGEPKARDAAGVIPVPAVRVVSPSGKPVTGATVLVRGDGDDLNIRKAEEAEGGVYKAAPLPAWSPSTGQPVISATAEFIVVAPDYVLTTATLEVPSREKQITVRLQKGRAVELVLKPAAGTSIPETLAPVIFDESTAIPAWMGIQPDARGRDFSLAAVRRTGPGRYTFHVAKETSGLYVLINEPGFLRGFQAGPFGADQLAKGRLEIELPKPYSVTARFRPAKAGMKVPYTECWAEIVRLQMLPGGRRWSFIVGKAEAAAPSLEATFADLAPPQEPGGGYSVSAGVGPYAQRFAGPPLPFRDQARVDFRGATTAVVEILYEPFDIAQIKGPYTAVVTALSLDGKPLAGKPYKVTYSDRKYGEQVVVEGTIPTSGVVEIRGLAGGLDKPTSLSELRAKVLPTFDFVVGDQEMGSIRFFKFDEKNEMVLPADTDKVAAFTFRMPPVVGDLAPDIELTEVFGDGTVRLADLKGQVVFLDFWATWCGPCQEPMKALNELAAKHKDDWQGKVVLIGASIDESKATVQKHVKKNGWESVRQMWCAGPDGTGGWESPQPRAYGVRGVPTALLINQEGRIVWRGHPHAFDKEGEITKLLQGK
jgi:thiol-disulfide isomerase/thioredoxin